MQTSLLNENPKLQYIPHEIQLLSQLTDQTNSSIDKENDVVQMSSSDEKMLECKEMKFKKYDIISLFEPDFLELLKFNGIPCRLVVIQLGGRVTFTYDYNVDIACPMISDFSEFVREMFDAGEGIVSVPTIKKDSLQFIINANESLVGLMLGQYFMGNPHHCRVCKLNGVYRVVFNKRRISLQSTIYLSNEEVPGYCCGIM